MKSLFKALGYSTKAGEGTDAGKDGGKEGKQEKVLTKEEKAKLRLNSTAYRVFPMTLNNELAIMINKPTTGMSTVEKIDDIIKYLHSFVYAKASIVEPGSEEKGMENSTDSRLDRRRRSSLAFEKRIKFEIRGGKSDADLKIKILDNHVERLYKVTDVISKSETTAITNVISTLLQAIKLLDEIPKCREKDYKFLTSIILDLLKRQDVIKMNINSGNFIFEVLNLACNKSNADLKLRYLDEIVRRITENVDNVDQFETNFIQNRSYVVEYLDNFKKLKDFDLIILNLNLIAHLMKFSSLEKSNNNKIFNLFNDLHIYYLIYGFVVNSDNELEAKKILSILVNDYLIVGYGYEFAKIESAKIGQEYPLYEVRNMNAFAVMAYLLYEACFSVFVKEENVEVIDFLLKLKSRTWSMIYIDGSQQEHKKIDIHLVLEYIFNVYSCHPKNYQKLDESFGIMNILIITLALIDNDKKFVDVVIKLLELITVGMGYRATKILKTLCTYTLPTLVKRKSSETLIQICDTLIGIAKSDEEYFKLSYVNDSEIIDKFIIYTFRRIDNRESEILPSVCNLLAFLLNGTTANIQAFSKHIPLLFEMLDKIGDSPHILEILFTIVFYAPIEISKDVFVNLLKYHQSKRVLECLSKMMYYNQNMKDVFRENDGFQDILRLLFSLDHKDTKQKVDDVLISAIIQTFTSSISDHHTVNQMYIKNEITYATLASSFKLTGVFVSEETAKTFTKLCIDFATITTPYTSSSERICYNAEAINLLLLEELPLTEENLIMLFNELNRLIDLEFNHNHLLNRQLLSESGVVIDYFVDELEKYLKDGKSDVLLNTMSYFIACVGAHNPSTKLLNKLLILLNKSYKDTSIVLNLIIKLSKESNAHEQGSPHHLQFSAPNSFLQIESVASRKPWPPQIGYSFCAWFKISSTNPVDCIVLLSLVIPKKYNNKTTVSDDDYLYPAKSQCIFRLTLEKYENRLRIFAQTGSSTSKVILPYVDIVPNQWHHIVVTHKQEKNFGMLLDKSATGRITLYFNGYRVDSAKLSVSNSVQNKDGTKIKGFVGADALSFGYKKKSYSWQCGPIILCEGVVGPTVPTALFMSGPNYNGTLSRSNATHRDLRALSTATIQRISSNLFFQFEKDKFKCRKLESFVSWNK